MNIFLSLYLCCRSTGAVISLFLLTPQLLCLAVTALKLPSFCLADGCDFSFPSSFFKSSPFSVSALLLLFLLLNPPFNFHQPFPLRLQFVPLLLHSLPLERRVAFQCSQSFRLLSPEPGLHLELHSLVLLLLLLLLAFLFLDTELALTVHVSFHLKLSHLGQPLLVLVRVLACVGVR